MNVDANSAASILDMLISFSSVTDICVSIIESEFVGSLLDFCHDAPFVIRKYSLSVLMELFLDGRDKNRFFEFLIENENRDFFTPFMETEDKKVMFTVLNALVEVVDEAEVTAENEIPPMYDVFVNSSDMMEMIEEVADYDVEENDSNLKHNLVDAANLILSKMISYREIAESL